MSSVDPKEWIWNVGPEESRNEGDEGPNPRDISELRVGDRLGPIGFLDVSGRKMTRPTHANPRCPQQPQKTANGQLTTRDRHCSSRHVSTWGDTGIRTTEPVQAIDRVRGPDNSITIGIEEIEVLVMRKTIITVADSPLDVER
jgi:hypothetical protein